MLGVVDVHFDPEVRRPGRGRFLKQLIEAPLVGQLKPYFGCAASRDDFAQDVKHGASGVWTVNGQVVHAVAVGDALLGKAAHRQEERKDFLDVVPGVIRFLPTLHQDRQHVGVSRLPP